MNSSNRRRCLQGIPLLVGLALLAATVPATSLVAGRAAAPFTVETLAEGVHLFRVPATDLEHTNALVIERRDGLVVVESQPSPVAAERFLTQLRQKLDAPIRYLVLGHAHTESNGGASAFPAEATVVVSRNCARSLADPEFDIGAETRLRAADPAGWKAPPRARPDLIVHGLTELADPRTPVQLSVLPPGHTQGDLAVLLPSQGIAYIGPMLFRRDNPYPGGGRLAAWVGGLNQIVRHETTTRFIPLRGETMDRAEVGLDRDSLAWLRGQVSLAFVEGIDPADMPEYLATRPDTPKYFSPLTEPSFFRLLANQAVEETVAERRKRGWSE